MFYWPGAVGTSNVNVILAERLLYEQCISFIGRAPSLRTVPMVSWPSAFITLNFIVLLAEHFRHVQLQCFVGRATDCFNGRRVFVEDGPALVFVAKFVKKCIIIKFMLSYLVKSNVNDLLSERLQYEPCQCLIGRAPSLRAKSIFLLAERFHYEQCQHFTFRAISLRTMSMFYWPSAFITSNVSVLLAERFRYEQCQSFTGRAP